MTRDTRKLELYIGAFIVAGVIIIGGMVVLLGGVLGVLHDTYKVVVLIDHIGDLKTGAPVKLGGVEIGRVAEISLDKRIQIVLAIQAGRDIPEDSQAHITNSGLVGDTFLEISRGKSRIFLPKTPDIQTAPRIEGVGPVDMNRLFKKVEDIGTEVTAIVDNLNAIVGDEDVQKNIKGAIRNVNATAIEAKQLLASLRRTSDRIHDASRNVVEVTETVKAMTEKVRASVDATIGSPETVAAVQAAVANIRDVSERSKALVGKAEAMFGRIDTILEEKDADIRAVVTSVKEAADNARAISERARELAAAIDPDKGVMKLFTSTMMEEEVGDTFDQVKDILDKVSRLLGSSLTDVLTEMKAAERIYALWHKAYGRHYRTPEETRRAWINWLNEQKAVHGRLIDPKYPEGFPWKEEE